MSYRIEVKRSAQKALLALPATTRERLVRAIDALALDPHPNGYRKLTGSDSLYRFRVGDYRVVHEIQDDRLVVIVVKHGHRREIYR